MKRTEYQILLATVASITFAAGALIVGFQVVVREFANEPQRQMVDQIAGQLREGKLTVADDTKVDLSSSQAPFVIVYDQDKRIVASSGVLHETSPKVPDGALEATAGGTTNMITWVPESGIRLAAVIRQVSASDKTFYILSARSLAATETLKASVTQIIASAWVAVMLLLGVAAYFEGLRAGRQK